MIWGWRGSLPRTQPTPSHFAIYDWPGVRVQPVHPERCHPVPHAKALRVSSPGSCSTHASGACKPTPSKADRL